MKAFLRTTVGWAMIFFLLAAISPAMAWHIAPDFQYGQAYSGALTWGSAYADWHGATITTLGLAGFLFLIAVSPLTPAPWWRTLVVGILGAAIVAIIIVYSTHA